MSDVEMSGDQKLSAEDLLCARQRHPEMSPGEYFLGNFSVSGDELPIVKGFKDIGYASKRIGRFAYDINWEVLRGLVPVFVSKSEYQEVQIKYGKKTKRKSRKK